MTHPITAWAACNGLGATCDAIGDALCAGQSGLSVVQWPGLGPRPYGSLRFELPALSGELADFDCRQARLAAHLTQGILPAVRRAVARHGSERVGLVVGTSTGGIAHTEDALAHWARTQTLPDDFDLHRRHQMAATTDVIGALTGIEGPSLVVSTACSSSGKVFGTARRWLQTDVVDAVLVGGVDSRSRLTVYGFSALDVLDEQPCRPFSQNRRGINLGEGGALLLLERDAEAPVHLWGIGESSDAHHMSAPHPEGTGAILAMERALHDAGIEASSVGHVHAHGTATMLGDRAEAIAVATVFGEGKPVWATKGAVGHTLGAAGSTEAVLSVEMLRRGRLPASPGATPRDPELPVDVIDDHRPMPTGLVISNSFAFGGSNVAIILGGPP